jgi:SAM-dependent methyltransferase
MVKYRQGSVGVDVNQFNVEFCRWRGLEAHLMPYDQLPFDTASFDSLLLDNVLEHISDPVPLLNEIKRVMRPDGYLVIAVPGLYGQLCDSDHKFYYNEASLTELAGSLGFTIEKFLYTPFFRSVLLSQTLKQYCIYSQWTLKSKD